MKQKMQIQRHKLIRSPALLCCIFAALFLLPTLAPTLASAQDTTTGLVGHWKLDETTGTTAAPVRDSSGNGYDGTMTFNLSQTSSIRPAPINTGRRFPFNSDEIEVNHGGGLDNLNQMTLSAWVYRINNGGGAQGRIITIPGNFEFTLRGDSLGFAAFRWDGTNGSWNNGSALPKGKWYHYAVTYDYTSASNAPIVYVNGELYALSGNPSTPSGTAANVSGNLYIGNNGSANLGMGGNFMDDVRIYNRVLTPEDITALYNTAPCVKTNEGSSIAGELIYNEDYRVMQYCAGDGWQSMGKGASLLHGQKTSGEDYDINAVEFDGTNDYLGGNLSEVTASDSKQATFSFWFNPSTVTGTQHIYVNDTPGGSLEGLTIFLNNNEIRIRGGDASTTEVFRFWPGGAYTFSPNQWYHVIFSFDLTDPNRRAIYINDTDTTPAGSNTDSPVDFSSSGFYVGATVGGGNKLNGFLADFWIDFGTYIDLSIEANRRKFINADGQAVNLGADGSRPTGTVPDIFLSGDTDSWHTNKGTGGGFTENGALTDAASLPPSATAKKLVGWWKLDETTGTTATDSSGEGNDGTLSGTDFAASSLEGPSNKGLLLDGVDDCTTITGTEQDYNLDILTVSAWVKLSNTSGPQKRIATKGATAWDLQIQGNGFVFFTDTTDDSGANLRINRPIASEDLNKWSHLVGTYDGSTMALYINGNLHAAIPQTGKVNDSTSLFGIGCIPPSFGLFGGAIDDVRIYNYALSPAEIAELFAASNTFYKPNAVEFDGTNDYLSAPAGSGFTQNSKQISGSFWVNRKGSSGDFIGHLGGLTGVYINRTFNSALRIASRGIASGEILQMLTAANTLPDNEWLHIMFSADVRDASKRHIYINGIDRLDTTSAAIDEDMRLSAYTLYIGGRDAANITNSDFADIWLSDEYIDFSKESNRQKFIDENANARFLGANGELPTGTAPDIFLSGDTATWHTNDGTGGGFTENGTLTDATSSPQGEKQPRYCTSPVQPEGTLIYNTDEHVMQYCDGFTYRPLGPPGDGGGGCSDPSGSAGFLYYNTDFKTIKYCEGDEWIGVGRDGTALALANGLVGHWKLDETTGTTATDSSGNGNDGTMQNGLDASSDSINGAISTALNFDGIDTTGDYISIPDDNSLDISSQITMSAWIRLSSVNDNYSVIAKNNAYTLFGNNGTTPRSALNFSGFQAYDFGFNESHFEDTWRHISLTYDGSNVRTYVDGTLDQTYPQTGNISVSSAELRIGQDTIAIRNFDGAIDDVRIYNRALSAAEITALYNLNTIDPCADSPSPGDVCRDGTIYAGISPDGSVPMFTTPADAGSFVLATDTVSVMGGGAAECNWPAYTEIDCRTGEANTLALATIVSSATSPSAIHCNDLTAHGKTDWYQPSREELMVLEANKTAIGGFNTSATPSSWYWASNYDGASGLYVRFDNGATALQNRNNPNRVRCVRKN